MAGPEEDYQARQEEEGQDSGAHADDKCIGIAGVDHESDAFEIAVRIARRTRSIEIGEQGGHQPRQGRMLRLVAVNMLREIFEAARQVLRLIVGEAELGIRCHDAQAADGHAAERNDESALVEERTDARIPQTGRRSLRGFPGGDGQLFGFLPGHPGNLPANARCRVRWRP
jgi:hypothetical protein